MMHYFSVEILHFENSIIISQIVSDQSTTNLDIYNKSTAQRNKHFRICYLLFECSATTLEAVKSTGAIKKVTFADPIPTIDSKIEGALDEESYTVVQRNKRLSKVRTVIHGTAANTELKGAIKHAYLHVYRLDKDTSVNDIQGYLKSKNFKDIICEKLASKHPDEYASFKISVPITILEEIKSPNLWPVSMASWNMH
ncbi:hypothetical protein QE152_g23787 [Popillia japonica]|uniref:Uncharacterized protein n=1 Tax=Popillia japonica TaxID=7064 RepID=A0AAW1KGT3_POPJA